ncbi:helix-turn-helix domain-containing protein [Nocardioides sp. KR10-350]|uniref:helix-turn-helix domain-containing protein n=1 Tax=Nocardioides cheoyonin TaxID=3156615 RepID=UPI0032B3E72C
MAGEITIDDPRVLRAIAHPVRMRILDEFDSSGSQRAADIAAALGIPANQASFHLRQLAKYGLVVEAPEEARDGRDRVWRRADVALNLDSKRLDETPGGRAALDAFMARWFGQAHELIDRVASPHKREGTTATTTHETLRLTRDEARQLSEDLSQTVRRWTERTRGRTEEVRYEILAVVAPGPDGERGAGRPEED